MDKHERRQARRMRKYAMWQYTQLFRGLFTLPFWTRVQLALKLVFRG